MILTYASIGKPAVAPFISWTLYGTFVREIDVGNVSLDITKLRDGEQVPETPESAKSDGWPRQ